MDFFSIHESKAELAPHQVHSFVGDALRNVAKYSHFLPPCFQSSELFGSFHLNFLALIYHHSTDGLNQTMEACKSVLQESFELTVGSFKAAG